MRKHSLEFPEKNRIDCTPHSKKSDFGSSHHELRSSQHLKTGRRTSLQLVQRAYFQGRVNLAFAVSLCLITACVLILFSWIQSISSRASPSSTPEVTPRVWLPYIARGVRPPVMLPPPGDWLSYINYYRATAELPPVTENPTWSDGCWKHARYMVKNDVVEHTEDPDNPWYSSEGLAAGLMSIILGHPEADVSDEYAIDSFMLAPFHAVYLLEPTLLRVGYGSYREPDGGIQMGAAVDVLHGRGVMPPSVKFPIRWPGPGMTVPVYAYLGEYPDALASCPGYSVPAGLPVILQIGLGELTPSVTAHSFRQGTTLLEHCVFDETTYTNPDAVQQSLGRSVLDNHDAVVLIPRAPLVPGSSYVVSITVNGETHTWTFAVSNTALSAGGLGVFMH